MARNTNIGLRNQVMYSIFVRNHSKEGNFQGVEKDLDRIKALGVDIIWLMPIHPIGVKNRKGTLGCPYAIQDYRKINPEYGDLEDLKHLVEEIHKREMKCIIDVVYNHTSPDSWLVENHSEWFYKKADGAMGNKIGDWSDVVDLDYQNKGLWNYQIDTLKMWAQIVDGFRCDVASMVPIDFWMKARQEVAEVREDCIWLSESLDINFITYIRNTKNIAHSDAEVYQAFDICYDYDVKSYFDNYLKGNIPLSIYVDILNRQEAAYPVNYVKLRFLENHDNPRAKSIIPDENNLMNWTAFYYCLKGTALIYAGQEVENDHQPSLFDIDKVDWNAGKDISYLFKQLYSIKKNTLMRDGQYHLEANDSKNIVTVTYKDDTNFLIGIFSLKGDSGAVPVEIPDGEYYNILDGEKVKVINSEIKCSGKPIIIQN